MPAQYFSIPLGPLPQLVEMQNLLRRKLPEGAVFNDPATFHITLVYIEDTKGAADLNLDDVANDLPIFGVGADYITSMQTPQNTAIVLRVSDSPQLTYLQSALYYKATRAGMKISEYSYPQRWRCHITLATIPNTTSYGISSGVDTYLSSEVHAEVRGFVRTDGEDTAPAQAWNLRADMPIQEFLNGLFTPNVSTEMETLNIQEQAETKGDKTHITLTVVTEMKGGYPNIPLPADVDVKTLQEQGRRFVTLPVGQVDAQSRNDRIYRRPAMEQMVQQINENRPEGDWGHIPDDQMGTFYGPPAVRWLAATIDQKGTVWAKGLPLTAESQRYFDDARLTGARVGTSLHAFVGMEGNEVQDMNLIRLDLADPARVGVPMTAAAPVLSTEMQDPDEPDPLVQETEAVPSEDPNRLSKQLSEETMPENSNPTTATELENERKVLLKELEILRKESRELSSLKRDLEYAYELLHFEPNADLVGSVRQYVEKRDDLVKENVLLLGETITALITSKVKVESARPIVEEMVRDQKPTTKRDLERAVEQVLGRESVKALLKAGLVEEMGEAQPPAPTQRPNPSDPAKATEQWLEPLSESEGA